MGMESKREIVLTGAGVVSPIGVGTEAFWGSLVARQGGIAALAWTGGAELTIPMGGAVRHFEPARFVRPRKNLKVMGREIQLAVAAAEMACVEAKIGNGAIDPERLGVVFGADTMITDLDDMVSAYRVCKVDGEFSFDCWGERGLAEMFPLWMLKYLPNMPACHIGIAHDARGPNNSHTHGDVSSLTALAEAARVIERGQADAMIAGGVSCKVHPLTITRFFACQMSRRSSEPEAACRPFDADRDGMVLGEGSAAFVLESRQAAEARGATPLARIVACAGTYAPALDCQARLGGAIRRAIAGALEAADLRPADIGHVNAHGLSTTEDDQIEAQAIRDVLGDVPVTAPKSYFGNLGAGAGAVEMLVSVLGLKHGLVPPTLNYRRPDPACPIRVVHGEPIPVAQPYAMLLNHSFAGQAAAVILGPPD
jgi:3-oxoacyl-[acyl-carrier-protein] synthase II